MVRNQEKECAPSGASGPNLTHESLRDSRCLARVQVWGMRKGIVVDVGPRIARDWPRSSPIGTARKSTSGGRGSCF